MKEASNSNLEVEKWKYRGDSDLKYCENILGSVNEDGMRMILRPTLLQIIYGERSSISPKHSWQRMQDARAAV